jgi:exocyst complex component 7
MRGPNDDLKGYLEAVDRLRSVARFFSSNKSYKRSDGVLSQVNSLLAKAISKMENEFQKQITSRRFFQLNFDFCLYLLYDL